VNDQIDPARAGKLLAAATSEAFAEMTFIDVSPIQAGDGLPEAGQDVQCAAIDVMAPLSCRIEMKVPPAIRDRVIDALFSESPERDRKKNAEDSVLEMLNVITGNFLSAYFGPQTEVRLSLPRYLYLDERLPGTAVADLRLNAEGTPLDLTLFSVRYRY